MKTIAITGGKGGTGKSTVAVLSAKELSQKNKVLLVDLDVECPNDYLITNCSLKSRIASTHSDLPKIDESKCQKCGECVAACTSNALFQPKGKVPILLPDLCSACQTCLDVCPHQAITSKSQETGEIFRNELSENLTLITGQAKTSVIETASIVRQTKDCAIEIAKKENFGLIIFDTAAGTHCPVVVALLGVDIAVAVTEPTPMGAHDLDLILQLLQKLKIEFKTFLNQSDLGNQDSITTVLKKFGQKTWDGEMLYSKELAKAYAQSVLLEANTPKLEII